MTPARMDRVEAAIRAALAFKDAFNSQDIAVMMTLLSEDCVAEGFVPAPDGAVYRGKEAIAGYYEDFFARFPDAQLKVEDVFGFGKRCIMRWKLEWGENRLRGVDIVCVEGEVICEVLSYAKSEEARS